jgi:hypothetical protein
MNLKYCVPLFTFVLPTLVIGFGVVIPNSPIAGVNSLTIGFGATSSSEPVSRTWQESRW